MADATPLSAYSSIAGSLPCQFSQELKLVKEAKDFPQENSLISSNGLIAVTTKSCGHGRSSIFLKKKAEIPLAAGNIA